MRLAMLGTRGVPASYSGFETCVESLGSRFAARGHDVLVYCRAGRTGQAGQNYKGMRRVMLPYVPTKGLETITHSGLSTLHAVTIAKPDAAIVFGVGNTMYARRLLRAGVPTVLNVDGADWARPKWGPVGRSFLRWSESRAAKSPAALVADSRAVAAYYLKLYGVDCVFIPYGADTTVEPPGDTLRELGVQAGGYLLAVGRLEPENGFHILIQAYESLGTDMAFVIVGDAPYNNAYKDQLKKLAPPGVLFAGYRFGKAYQELSSNAYAFLFGAEVGGTHPVLVEQLAHGNCIVARWTDSNAEVLADAGLLFRDSAGLQRHLRMVLTNAGILADMRRRARERSKDFSWDRIADHYEDLIKTSVRAGVRGRSKNQP